MADLRATPYANPLTGLSNDVIQGLLGYMKDKQRTQQMQGLASLLESTGIPKTVERAAYAESPIGLLNALTNVNRANVPLLKPETAEAMMNVAPFVAPTSRALMQATKGLPVGASIKDVGQQGLLDIAKRDASDIFGAGAQRVKYTDPRSGGTIDVLARPDGTASVLELQVPEKFRGKGIGESLQKQVLQDFPDMQGQVSSKAAATTAYRLGRRPVGMPNATLKDVHKMIDDDSSVNMISPKMQERISPSASYPQQEALDTTQEGLLATQSEQPMQGLLQSKIPSPSSLTMPDVPTVEQMQKYGRVETVPLSQAVSFQSARNWDKFNRGEHVGDLVQGFGDKPLALRLENGEYVIYDGNHRTDLAMQAGKTELPMNVIDVRSYDPAHAGRKPVPPTMSDDELLRSLLE